MTPLPVIDAAAATPSLQTDPDLTARWLEAFLRDELISRRGMANAVVGLAGGVDSAVTAFLCARALGPKRLWAIRMPYRTSSPASLSDAQSRKSTAIADIAQAARDEARFFADATTSASPIMGPSRLTADDLVAYIASLGLHPHLTVPLRTLETAGSRPCSRPRLLQISTTSLPIGARAMPASFRCWRPKGR